MVQKVYRQCQKLDCILKMSDLLVDCEIKSQLFLGKYLDFTCVIYDLYVILNQFHPNVFFIVLMLATILSIQMHALKRIRVGSFRLPSDLG